MTAELVDCLHTVAMPPGQVRACTGNNLVLDYLALTISCLAAPQGRGETMLAREDDARTRCRASLRLFVSARSHLAEQGLHLCAKRKFVRAAQRKGAGGPARNVARSDTTAACAGWRQRRS